MVAYEAIWEKDSGDEVETVEAGGNGVQNPCTQKKMILSVVQTPVEVTESSLLSN